MGRVRCEAACEVARNVGLGCCCCFCYIVISAVKTGTTTSVFNPKMCQPTTHAAAAAAAAQATAVGWCRLP